MTARCDECGRSEADGARMELQCGCPRAHGLCQGCQFHLDGSLRLLYFRARCPRACLDAPVYRWGKPATEMVKMVDLRRVQALAHYIPAEVPAEAVKIVDLLRVTGVAEVITAELTPLLTPPGPGPAAAPAALFTLSQEILWALLRCLLTLLLFLYLAR